MRRTLMRRKRNSPRRMHKNSDRLPMNPEETQPAPKTPPEESEPKAGLKLVPIWLVIAFAVLFYWGQLYLDAHSGGFNALVHEPYRNFATLQRAQPTVHLDPFVAMGRDVYNRSCVPCHQGEGQGVPRSFPRLVGSELVLDEGPERLIRIVLHGMAGRPEYGQSMFAFATILNDEEIAAVLTYIRQAWGNQAAPVSEETVVEVRQAERGRVQPWTIEELMAIPVGEAEPVPVADDSP
jgi:mono/diheme cytochrome c family protein